MRMSPLIAAAAAAAALFAPAQAQVFKWTDADGRTHYGDRPPGEASTQEIRIRPTSFDGPAQLRDWSEVLRRKPEAGAAPPPGITMYSTEWCGHCRNAREYFKANGIDYTEIDVEKSEAGRREFAAYRGRGVPLIVSGKRTLRGFSPKAFEALRRK